MKNIRTAALLVAGLMAVTPSAKAYDMGKVGQPVVISSNSDHCAAIDPNNTLWMWGSNDSGELGNGWKGNATGEISFTDDSMLTAYYQTVPAKIMENVRSVSTGYECTAILKTDGTLWICGGNNQEQLGIGKKGDKTHSTTTGDFFRYQTVPAKLLDQVAAVSIGESHGAAIKTDGSLWMWGLNWYGQLGVPAEEKAFTPVKVMDNVVAVSCGYDYTAAIKKDGSLWVWGRNVDGVMGASTIEYSSTPVKMLDNAVAVSAGSYHVAAIKSDGTLWAWGSNVDGQIGNRGMSNGTNLRGDICQSVPVKVLDNVSYVQAGETSTAAVLRDGSLFTWGKGMHYIAPLDLGKFLETGEPQEPSAGIDLPKEVYSVPTKTGDNTALVCAGSDAKMLVKTDGSVWTWGAGYSGTLGTGSNEASPGAVRVPNLTAKLK